VLGTLVYFMLDPHDKIDDLNRLIENDNKSDADGLRKIIGEKKEWMGLRAIFLSMNLIVATFFGGLVVGKLWYIEMQYSYKPTLITIDGGGAILGRIMHPGDKAMLFYRIKDDDGKNGGIRLVAREKVKDVLLCNTIEECKAELLKETREVRVSPNEPKIASAGEVREKHVLGHARRASTDGFRD
jgi:hypothetical protein